MTRNMATITPEQAKEVAKSTKHEGRLHLARCLQWNSSDHDDEVNMRGAIHLDYLYDSLEFAVNKGFPWKQVCAIVTLAEEVIQKTVQKDIELNQAIVVYKDIVVSYLDQISEKNLKIYTSYVFSTFMAHYKLYQFVFTRPREPQVSQCHMDVNIPPEVLPLKDGKPLSIWKYEQKMEALEEEEQARMDVLRAQRQSLLEEQDTLDHAMMETVADPSAPLPEQDLTELIKNMAEEQASYTEKILQTNVEEKHEDLEYYFQKTSLPRPIALGPPPRTKGLPRFSAKSKQSSRGTGAKTGMSEAKSVRSMKSKSPAKAAKT